MNEELNISTLGTNTKRNYFNGRYIHENIAIAEDVIAYASKTNLGVCFIQGATPEMGRIFSSSEKFIFAGSYRCNGKINELGSKLLTFVSSLKVKKTVLNEMLKQKSLKPISSVPASWGNETAGILIDKDLNPRMSQTVDLPSKGIQRHYTETLVDFNGLPTVFMGTHLTHNNKKMRLEQLDIFFERAKEQLKNGVPIIMSGLFNINKEDTEEYGYLKEKMETLGLQEVPVTENTYISRDKQGNLTKNSGVKSYILCSKEFTFTDPIVLEENPSFKHRPINTTVILSEYGLQRLNQYKQELHLENNVEDSKKHKKI